MEQTMDKPVDMYYWKLCLFDDGIQKSLKGNVIGHPYIEDKHRCHTSEIIGVNVLDDFVLFYTKNTIYKCRYVDCEEITEQLRHYPVMVNRVELALAKKKIQELRFLEKLNLKEKEVCLFVSTLKSYYFEKAYAVLNGKRVSCNCGVNVGMFQDSVMFNSVPRNRDLGYAFFPYIDGRLEFYVFPNDHIYVVNTGFEDMEIDVPFGKFLVKAGGYEKICKENKKVQIEESIAHPVDKHSLFEEVIVDGQMIGYHGIKSDKKT